MEGQQAGGSKKSTVYVAGFDAAVNEQQLLEHFVTFGDILEISIPHDPQALEKHRGFAFITYTNPADAQDAIDNYDLNELPGYQGRGRVLKCSLAQPDRYGKESRGEGGYDKAVWEKEEYIQEHVRPGQGAEDGGDADDVEIE